jgi:hypothetical protein
MVSLKSWLRRHPQPHSVRVIDADGNDKALSVVPGRNCWKNLETTIGAIHGATVECLSKDGEVIRATNLDTDDGAAGTGAPVDAEEATIEKTLGRERRELAGLLDNYGKRLNEAYQLGAKSGDNSREQLVSLVDVLTGHLTAAITNLHSVSVQFAKMTSKEDDDGATKMLEQVIAMGAAKAMNGGGERKEK